MYIYSISGFLPLVRYSGNPFRPQAAMESYIRQRQMGVRCQVKWLPTTWPSLPLFAWRYMLQELRPQITPSCSTTVTLTNCAYGNGEQGSGANCLPRLTFYFYLFLFWRPSTTEARIPPSELRSYRCSHCMLGPCCLCPLRDPNAPDYVEAAIYRVRSSTLSESGEYVASCARDKCGYFGKSLELLVSRKTRLTFNKFLWSASTVKLVYQLKTILVEVC
jgi:hypothetical protein